MKNNNEYFEYLCSFVCDDYQNKYYDKLLRTLFETDFYAINDMDNNRISDGFEMRDRFVNDGGIISDPQNFIGANCSILELMVALAIRCEIDIMHSVREGDRTAVWFWKMVGSLGLNDMDDGRYDNLHVNYILEDFINHNYTRDGKGGLFYVQNSWMDMRDLEIWSQMNLFLSTILF